MVEEKIKILAIGEGCKHNPCLKKIADNDLNGATIIIDFVDSLEMARQQWQDTDYDFFLICNKNRYTKNFTQLIRYCPDKYENPRPHDQLTGLYSRSFFLKQLGQIETGKQLPLSIIIGDLNGLKLFNDIFGYNNGDKVIKEVAEIFRKNCGKDSMIARWGGDEFAAVLPGTPDYLSSKVLEGINRECSKANTVPIKITMALGMATKERTNQDILEVLHQAEVELYLNKMMEEKNRRHETIASLVKLLGEKDYETEEHTWRMQNLAIGFGLKLGLTESQMEDLIQGVTLHDIGKLAVPEDILMKPGSLNSEEWTTIKEHSAKGYRIALSSNKLAQIAPIILAHHERWDGLGYPQGLRGKEIPLLARIITIVDSYDVMTNERPYKKAMSKAEARQELQRSAGSQFDPDLVKIFLGLEL